MDWQTFANDAISRVETASNFLELYGLHDELYVDHICYKCGSHDEFVKMRAMLEPEAIYLYESWINGRLIAILRLKSPLVYKNTIMNYVELQDKKEGKEVVPGFTHIEFFSKTMMVKDVAEMLMQKGIEVVDDPTPHHPIYDISLAENFTLRLESGLVIEKIKKEEMI